MFNKNMKSKNVIFAVIVVAALIIALSVLVRTPSTVQQHESMMESPTPTSQPAAVPAKPKAITPSAEDYSALVVQYEGKRIQFDALCQANPSNVTFKNGTKILLDNRSGDARIITVGTTQYNLAGYGYKVVTLTATSFPKTLYLSCGSAVNVGQILLQANIGNSL